MLNDECFDAFFSPYFASIVHKSAFKWHHCQTSPNNVRSERKSKVLFSCGVEPLNGLENILQIGGDGKFDHLLAEFLFRELPIYDEQ